MKYSKVLYSTVGIHYSKISYSTIQYSIIQYTTIQYSTIQSIVNIPSISFDVHLDPGGRGTQLSCQQSRLLDREGIFIFPNHNYPWPILVLGLTSLLAKWSLGITSLGI